MATESDSLSQKTERAASEIIAFALAVVQLIFSSALIPKRAIDIIRSKLLPDHGGIGAAVYLAICSFIANTLPNFIARRNDSGSTPTKLGDIFVSLSFDGILMRILPTLLTCYVICSFYARQEHRSNRTAALLENYRSQYLFGAGFAILQGSFAITLALLIQQLTGMPDEYFKWLPIPVFTFVIVVLHKAFTPQETSVWRGARLVNDLFSILTFVISIWCTCMLWGWVDWKRSPPVKPGPVLIDSIWFEANENEARMTVFFVNNSRHHVYWQPGAVAVSTSNSATDYPNVQEGWTISRESSAKSLSSPGSSNTVTMTTTKLHPQAIREAKGFVLIGAHFSPFRNELNFPAKEGDSPQIKTIEWAPPTSLNYVQPDEVRNYIATTWERRNEEQRLAESMAANLARIKSRKGEWEAKWAKFRLDPSVAETCVKGTILFPGDGSVTFKDKRGQTFARGRIEIKDRDGTATEFFVMRNLRNNVYEASILSFESVEQTFWSTFTTTRHQGWGVESWRPGAVDLVREKSLRNCSASYLDMNFW